MTFRYSVVGRRSDQPAGTFSDLEQMRLHMAFATVTCHLCKVPITCVTPAITTCAIITCTGDQGCAKITIYGTRSQ